MSFCLILLAAGNSKRFNSKMPKPFVKVGGKNLLEHSLIKFSKIKQIKNIIVVINRKHKKPKKLKLKNIKLIGGKTRQDSTFNALKFIKKKQNVTKCLYMTLLDQIFQKKLIKKNFKKHLKNSRAVIPKIKNS